MNHKERCLAVINGRKPDRVPVIPQSFLFGIEHAGFKMKDVVFDGRKMARAHAICQDTFGYDGCVIDFDDATIAEACGAKVIHRDEEPAIVNEEEPVLASLDDIEDLPLPTPESGRIPVWLEATRELVNLTHNEVFIMGRADQGPFGLACLLRGTQQFMVDVLMEDPQKIKKVLDYCTKASSIFAKAQKDAGAHCTSIGDALAGPNLIPPDMFRSMVLDHHHKLTKELTEYGIPLSIHICGDTTEIAEDMASTGCAILELDWQVNFGEIRKRIPAVLMGNINPSDPMVFGSPETVAEATISLLESTGGRGLLMSTGCAMGRNTPLDHFKVLIDTTKNFPLP
jgi:uroporphyrinogen decarboxylase